MATKISDLMTEPIIDEAASESKAGKVFVNNLPEYLETAKQWTLRFA